MVRLDADVHNYIDKAAERVGIMSFTFAKHALPPVHERCDDCRVKVSADAKTNQTFISGYRNAYSKQRLAFTQRINPFTMSFYNSLCCKINVAYKFTAWGTLATSQCTQ